MTDLDPVDQEVRLAAMRGNAIDSLLRCQGTHIPSKHGQRITHPWVWFWVDEDGDGRYHATRAEAIAAIDARYTP